MAYRLSQACFDMDAGNLTPAQKASLHAICRYANDETGKGCFASTKLIAQKTGFNERTIMEAIKSLVKAGWIVARRSFQKRYLDIVDVSRIYNAANLQNPSSMQELTVLQEPAMLQETADHTCRKLHSIPAGFCTIKEHIKEQRKEQISLSSFPTLEEQTDDLFVGPGCSGSTPASKSSKNVLNPLIANENREVSMMGRNPADTEGEIELDALPCKEKCNAEEPDRTPAAKQDPIPYKRIAELYNERCVPPLPRAMNPSEQLKKNIRARCKDFKTIKGVKTVGELLDEFGKLFDKVAQSDWL